MTAIFDIELPLINLVGLVATVIPAAWNDYKKWRIPNLLLLWSALGAILLAIFLPNGIGAAASLQGAMVGFFMFLPLYLIRGMAAGDVKLLATLGLYSGPVFITGIGLLSMLVGGIWACIILLSYSNSFQIIKIWLHSLVNNYLYIPSNYKFKENFYYSGSELIPYGVVIAIGCISMIFINY